MEGKVSFERRSFWSQRDTRVFRQLVEILDAGQIQTGSPLQHRTTQHTWCQKRHPNCSRLIMEPILGFNKRRARTTRITEFDE